MEKRRMKGAEEDGTCADTRAIRRAAPRATPHRDNARPARTPAPRNACAVQRPDNAARRPDNADDNADGINNTAAPRHPVIPQACRRL